MAEEEDVALAEARKLPLAERVSHKNWKVRGEAYDSIASACERAFDSDGVTEYGSHLAKASADSNAAALDKALTATLEYFSACNEAQAARLAGHLCSAIAKQNLKQRPGIVRKSTDVCLALIELEQAEIVLEHLTTAYENKTPKVVVAALDIITEALREYGPKVMMPNSIIRDLPKLFEAKQVPIRDSVKKLAVELASWTGPGFVKTLLLKDMPELMRKDTEKLIDESSPGSKQPQRFTRREAARRAAAAQGMTATDAGDSTEHTAAQCADEAAPMPDMGMDAYDYAKPEDILSSLNKEFWDGLCAAKWQERRDSLQTLKQLASTPKLGTGEYADVVRELRKIVVKDSNVVCVAEAAACFSALAKGLRKDFSSMAKAHFGTILDKLKDKNTNVCTQSAQACITFHRYCLALDDVAGDFVTATAQKNPKLKAAALQVLQDCVDASSKEAIAKAHSTLIPAAAAAANDAMPNIREAALQLLTTFAIKAGSIKPIDRYAEKLDEVRKKKLDEMIAASRSGKPQGSAPKAALPEKALTSRDTNRQPAAAVAPAKKPLRPAAAAHSQNTKIVADDDDAALQMGSLSKAEVEEELAVLVGNDITSKLRSTNWKERLEAMGDLQQCVQDMKENVDVPTLFQGLSHLPGWTEKNFQVLGKAFEIIKQVSQAESGFGKRDAFVAVTGLVAKLSDAKLKAPACEALSALAETVGPQFVCAQVHKQAASQKNPKVLSEALIWMATAIQEFGLKQLDVKQLIEWMKADVSSTSAPVRTAAIALLGTAHRQLGPGLDPLLSQSVKPALMQTLRDTFKANPAEQVVPSRKVRGKAGVASQGAAGTTRAGATGGGASAAVAPADASDLLPRTDISASISARLADRFSSAKWQERNGALEEVSSILKAAGGHVQPSTGNLLSLLKGRLSDTNANLVARNLIVASELAAAMGPAWDRTARDFLKPALDGLADKKKPVRDGVITLLEAWVQVSSPERVLPGLADYLTSPKAAMAEGKAAAIQWARGAMQSGSGAACLESAVRVASLGVLDKGAETREAGTALMLVLAQVYGRAPITAAISHLTGPAKKAASEAFEKVAASKGGAAALQGAGPASDDSQMTAGLLPAHAGARPLSRGATEAPVASPRQRRSAAGSAPEAAGPGATGCLATSTKKEERARRFRGKATKFEAPGEEEEELLEAELGPIASEGLRPLLFAKDFQKHLEAIDMLQGELSSNQQAVMASLDLLLRWCVIRLCDPRANTTCLLKLLELCRAFLEQLELHDKQLTAAEAACFLPCVVEKSGHNADRIRAQHRELLRIARRVHPVPKVLEYLAQGITSKSSRTRVESTEALGEVLAEEGLTVFERTREKPFPAIAQMVSDRDKGVRAAALALLQTLYQLAGPSQTWGLLGKLTSQQHSLIEERFKHRDKGTLTHSAQAKSPSAAETSGGQASFQASAAESAHGRVSTTTPLPDMRRALAGHAPEYGTMATPVPSATPMARPSVQMPSAQAASDSITPLAPAALAARQLNEAEDQMERWSRALQQLRCLNDETVYVEGMKMVSYDLMDAIKTPPDERVFQHYIYSAGEAVEAFACKVTQVFGMVKSHPEGAHRRCSYCLNALMQVYCFTAMAKAVPQDTLKKLICVVLLQLISPDRSQVDTDNTFLKALNVLMMRVLANSQKEAVIGALLELLEYTASSPDEQSKFKDLTVKCLIKVTKSLDEDIKTDRTTRALITALDLNRILMAIHRYFSSMTSQEIKARGLQEDKPLRMAKTLLHKICGLAGYEVLKHMQGVPEHGNPPPVIRLYVDLNLQTLVSADIVPQTSGSAENMPLPKPLAPLLTQDREANSKSGQMPHLSPEPLQQRMPVEGASRAPAERHTVSMPIPAAAQPTPNGQTTALSADIQPQPVQDGLSGPALTGQDAPAPAGTAGAADTRQEEAQGAGFKAYSKARKAPLIAVDANTQETASDAAPPAQQPDAQKQCTTPQAAGIDKREVGKIMQKLGQKGTTEEGLMDLYQYMQKHPHLKLDQIMNLSVASATFRKYLEDGLRKAAYRDKLAREGADSEANTEDQLPPPEHLRVPSQQRSSTPAARKTSYESLMARMAAIRNRGP